MKNDNSENEELIIRNNSFIQSITFLIPFITLNVILDPHHDANEVGNKWFMFVISVLFSLMFFTQRLILTKNGCYNWFGFTWNGKRVKKIFQFSYWNWEKCFINNQYCGLCLTQGRPYRVLSNYSKLLTSNYAGLCKYLYENSTNADMNRETYLYLLRIVWSKWPDYVAAEE